MYYVVIIQNDSAQAVYAYQTYDEALSAYHQELAYRGEGRNKTVCVILNSIGGEVCGECWERKVEEAETETQP